MIRYITDDLEIFSDDFDEENFDKDFKKNFNNDDVF